MPIEHPPMGGRHDPTAFAEARDAMRGEMISGPSTPSLGIVAGDPGCDAVFEALDRYAEAVLRGDGVTPEFARVVLHLWNCIACREDTEGLLAALRLIEPLSPET